MRLNAKAVAAALGGAAEGNNRVRAPGPGHRAHDDSLMVWLDANAPDGFRVDSFAGNDPMLCRDYVRARLGMPAWAPNRERKSGEREGVAAKPPLPPTRQREKARTLSPANKRLFESCHTITSESIAGNYLAGRGCALPHEDGDLRWHPNILHWRTGTRWPALVALITDVISNTPISLHFTFLAKDGSGKAPIERPRLVLKDHQMAGGVVRLWPDAHVTYGLLVGEGIETVLSAARVFTPVWACLNAGNVRTFPVLPGIDAITILQDDDEAGRRSTKACAERWTAAGRETRVWAPKHGP
jgi:putative DNA primase/helicase